MSDNKYKVSTIDGEEIELTILKMPTLLAEQLRQQMEQDAIKLYGEPHRPTYTFEAAGGPQTLPHDESTLETDRDRAVWAAYKDTEAKIERHVSRAMIDFALANCVEVPMPPNDEWLERLEASGVRIPEKKRQRQVLYLKTVITSAEDLNAISQKSMELAGVRRELVDAANGNFQGAQPGRRNAGRTAGANQPQA